ncbi:hypothetical protein I0600191H4_13490 [Collinsella sp. i06-0019-1H4]
MHFFPRIKEQNERHEKRQNNISINRYSILATRYLAERRMKTWNAELRIRPIIKIIGK